MRILFQHILILFLNCQHVDQDDILLIIFWKLSLFNRSSPSLLLLKAHRVVSHAELSPRVSEIEPRSKSLMASFSLNITRHKILSKSLHNRYHITNWFLPSTASARSYSRKAVNVKIFPLYKWVDFDISKLYCWQKIRKSSFSKKWIYRIDGEINFSSRLIAINFDEISWLFLNVGNLIFKRLSDSNFFVDYW